MANLQQTANLQVLSAAPTADLPSTRERTAILAKAKGQTIAEVDLLLHTVRNHELFMKSLYVFASPSLLRRLTWRPTTEIGTMKG